MQMLNQQGRRQGEGFRGVVSSVCPLLASV